MFKEELDELLIGHRVLSFEYDTEHMWTTDLLKKLDKNHAMFSHRFMNVSNCSELETVMAYVDKGEIVDIFHILIYPDITWGGTTDGEIPASYFVQSWSKKFLEENNGKPAISYMTADEILEFYYLKKLSIDQWNESHKLVDKQNTND